MGTDPQAMVEPRSARVRYARLAAEHLDVLLELARDAHVRRYLLDGALVEPSFCAATFAASDALFAARGVGVWLLFDDARDERIGFAGYHVFEEVSAEPQLFYALREPWTGRGLATEVAATLIAYARERGLATIAAAVDAPNVASIRVLEKLGFVRSGEAPGAFGETWLFELRA